MKCIVHCSCIFSPLRGTRRIECVLYLWRHWKRNWLIVHFMFLIISLVSQWNYTWCFTKNSIEMCDQQCKKQMAWPFWHFFFTWGNLWDRLFLVINSQNWIWMLILVWKCTWKNTLTKTATFSYINQNSILKIHKNPCNC